MLLIPLLALATAAYASEWVPVTTTAEGDTHYYDSEKLHVEDRTIVYWRKVDFRLPMPVRSALAHLGLYREQIDCVRRSLRPELEALQTRVRDLRRGLDMQETAGSGR